MHLKDFIARYSEKVIDIKRQLTGRQDFEFLCSLSLPQTSDLHERQTLSYDELYSTALCQQTQRHQQRQLQVIIWSNVFSYCHD